MIYSYHFWQSELNNILDNDLVDNCTQMIFFSFPKNKLILFFRMYFTPFPHTDTYSLSQLWGSLPVCFDCVMLPKVCGKTRSSVPEDIPILCKLANMKCFWLLFVRPFDARSYVKMQIQPEMVLLCLPFRYVVHRFVPCWSFTVYFTGPQVERWTDIKCEGMFAIRKLDLRCIFEVLLHCDTTFEVGYRRNCSKEVFVSLQSSWVRFLWKIPLIDSISMWNWVKQEY